MTIRRESTRKSAARRTHRAFGPALITLACAAGPAFAIAFFPPTLVGPPISIRPLACLSVATPQGKTLGAAVPIAGLALGAPVERNATAFFTGGSGTASFALEAQRRAAGLQWQPKLFDPAGKAKPSVYAADVSPARRPAAYQRLLLKPSKLTTLPYGLIYAQPVSATTGRIVSVGLTIATRPTARPKVTIGATRARMEGCGDFAPIDIYAPAMSVEPIRRLFTTPSCHWNSLKSCRVADRPRGRVLFVQHASSGVGYEHRWVDYDLLSS